MICKNCKTSISEASKYCNSCGAKVVIKRITVSGLLSDVAQNVFGWDNKFFLTIRTMITNPQVLLKEYIKGTRKKYMNPFTFLTLGAAISLFIFNFYSEEYLALNIESNKQTVEVMSNVLSKQYGEKFEAEKFEKEQLEIITSYSQFVLKYFNLLVLLLMPLYTFIAKLVFGKPYNYAEHLVINSYVQGITFWATSIVFVISVFTNPSVYIIALLFTVVYYAFVYGKLYNLNIWESILKLIIFIGILVGMLMLLGVLSFVGGLVFAYLKSSL